MSFLRLIFFLDVSRFVSLDLLVLSAGLASPRFPAYIFCLKSIGMSFLRLIFFLDVFYLDLLVLSPVLASPTFPAYYFLSKVDLSFLRHIFFLDVYTCFSLNCSKGKSLQQLMLHFYYMA